MSSVAWLGSSVCARWMRDGARARALSLVGAIAVAVLAGCGGDEPLARASASEVVYGVDDRVEVYAHPNAALRAVAENAVAIEMSRSWLDESSPSNVRVTYRRTLGEAKGLCAGEAFADQIEPGTCSGTLVDDRHVLTAAHCVDEARDCDGSRVWLFGLRYASAGALAALDADDVYTCRRVVGYDAAADHAFVELDRPVVGRTPASVSTARLTEGLTVALIGHPNGIPMKIASGGRITAAYSDGSYAATLDAFDGNSGSGVFDAAGTLIGVLTGGMDDYVSAGGCNVVNVIDPPPTDDGESLIGARVAVDAFCATPGLSSALCDCDGPCVTAPPGDTCDTAVALDLVDALVVNDTLAGFAPDSMGSCGGGGPDRVYALSFDRPGRLVARSSGFDTVLYLARDCGGAELACHDDVDVDTDRGSRIEVDVEAGSYALVLDAYDADVGAFTLELSFTPTGASSSDGGGVVAVDGGAPTGDAGPDASGPRSRGGCAVCVPSARADVRFFAGLAGFIVCAGAWRRRSRRL